jgi:transposase
MLLADRGYDANWIRQLVMKKGGWANIPPKSNRSDPICFSPHLYRARNQVEDPDFSAASIADAVPQRLFMGRRRIWPG